MMKRMTQVFLIVTFTLLPLAASAGNIDSPGAPGSGSGMPTLQELYDYLTGGAEPSAPGGFQEPTAGPGATMKTLKELYDDFKALIAQSTATPDQVLDTVTFFQTDPGNWGPTSGAIPTQGDVTGKAGQLIIPVPEGYYSGKTVTAVDPNLIPKNILCGVTIFGVTGTCPPRYTDNGDGTVTDNDTGLIWLKKANCGGKKVWFDAMDFTDWLRDGWTGDGSGGDCDLSDGSSYGDWRLPTRAEWEAMVDKSYTNPVLSNAARDAKWSEGDAFSGVQLDCYWSRSTVPSGGAWSVDMADGRLILLGYFSSSQDSCYVWPVRNGK